MQSVTSSNFAIYSSLLARYSKLGMITLCAFFVFGLTACEKPKGTLKINASIGDSIILINGEVKGNSPTDKNQTLDVMLPAGEYEVKAKKIVYNMPTAERKMLPWPKIRLSQ